MTSTDHTDLGPAKPARRARNSSRKPSAPQSKSESVTKLLARAKGATIAEVTAVTGWQAHSVRAFLSGLRKKGIGLVRDARKSGEAFYRTMPLITADGTPDIAAQAVAAMQPAALAGSSDIASDSSVA